MTNHEENIFLSEIILQCQYAFEAVSRLNAALQANGQADVVFKETYYIVLHAASISKFLWPIKRASFPRADWLRNHMGITSPHVLEDRELRNHYEHFDERLDAWAASQSVNNGNYADRNIGPRNMIVGLPDQAFLRHYDPTTNKFIFTDREYDIQALVTGIDDVLQKAKMRLQQIGR